MTLRDPRNLSGERMLEEWLRRLDKPSFVYVIRGDGCEPIKVGVAKDPLARMQTLQTGNWNELRLRYVVPGSYAIEADFHRRLSNAKLLGEWFTGPAVEDFMRWIEDYSHHALRVYDVNGTLPSALPKPRPINRAGIRSWGVHAWRTTDKAEPNPVTVRHVDPASLRS